MSWDWGTVIHFVWGLAGGVLGQPWLFTLIMLFKQFLDYWEGEDWPETSGDIAEFAAGLLVGLALSFALGG